MHEFQAEAAAVKSKWLLDLEEALDMAKMSSMSTFSSPTSVDISEFLSLGQEEEGEERDGETDDNDEPTTTAPTVEQLLQSTCSIPEELISGDPTSSPPPPPPLTSQSADSVHKPSFLSRSTDALDSIFKSNRAATGPQPNKLRKGQGVFRNINNK